MAPSARVPYPLAGEFRVCVGVAGAGFDRQGVGVPVVVGPGDRHPVDDRHRSCGNRVVADVSDGQRGRCVPVKPDVAEVPTAAIAEERRRGEAGAVDKLKGLVRLGGGVQVDGSAGGLAPRIGRPCCRHSRVRRDLAEEREQWRLDAVSGRHRVIAQQWVGTEVGTASETAHGTFHAEDVRAIRTALDPVIDFGIADEGIRAVGQVGRALGCSESRTT